MQSYVNEHMSDGYQFVQSVLARIFLMISSLNEIKPVQLNEFDIHSCKKNIH